jgi:hypothetical protein
MDRFARATAAGLILVSTALHAGCGSGASGLTTGATPSGDSPGGGLTNDNPMARPISVAWTSARAKRCGFYFDPAKLRSSYLAFEAQQGNAGDQMAKIQATYDQTYSSISGRISADADYCSDRKSADIKADLQRHMAGDYAPNLPKPKVDQSCGFFGCNVSSTDENFNSKDFWKKQDANPKGGSR